MRYSSFRRVRRSPQLCGGFALLELLIAVAILSILWGGVSHFLVAAMTAIKKVSAPSMTSRSGIWLARLDQDFYNNVTRVLGTQEKLVLETGTSRVMFRHEGGRILREEYGSESVVFKGTTGHEWVYLAKDGRWTSEWTSDQLPAAVLWKVRWRDDFIESVYPMRSGCAQ